MIENPERVRVEHIAWFLDWSVETVRRKLAAGEIPGRRMGRDWFVARSAFEKYLVAHGLEMAAFDKAVSALVAQMAGSGAKGTGEDAANGDA